MSPFQQAVFVLSAAALEQCPPSKGEIAFAGRSNSGKSSALNALTRRRRLAFVSKTPGRTQLINFFTIGNDRHIVDLPGYGYAKVPEATRESWRDFLGDYLRTREELRGIVLIMDARHPMTDLDCVLLAWILPTGRPVHALLTKTDKLSHTAAVQTLRKVRGELAAMSQNFSAQLFSSLKKTGVEEAEAVLGEWLGLSAESPAEKIKTPG